jgi:multiple sugar transport system permease protein
VSARTRATPAAGEGLRPGIRLDAPPAAAAPPTGKRGSWRRSLLLTGALTVGLVLLVAPFVWMLLSSFKTPAELAARPPTLVPHEPTLANYDSLFRQLDFGRYFANSAVVAGLVTLANLLFCSMLGYALAKLRFAGRRALFGLVLGTLLVPSSVTLVPLFAIMSALNLVNSFPALILPFAAGPFGVFLMRQFMSQLPDELLDAGRVDGAGELYLFWRVALPLCGPPLATLGILTFLASWNNFIWPLIVTTDQDMFTLPVALANFATDPNHPEPGVLMAGSAVIVLPILLVFVVLQRFFTRGIAMTGIKG